MKPLELSLLALLTLGTFGVSAQTIATTEANPAPAYLSSITPSVSISAFSGGDTSAYIPAGQPSRYGAIPLWLRPSTYVFDRGVRTQSALYFFSAQDNRKAQIEVLAAADLAAATQGRMILTCDDPEIHHYCQRP